jgi:hypothetical protein
MLFLSYLIYIKKTDTTYIGNAPITLSELVHNVIVLRS